MTVKAALIILCLSLLNSACSSEQIYAAGRNAQRAQCAQMPAGRERDQCFKDADMTYGTYKRESTD
jgi:major membrane immunogen (membrane-anchored lipoprotein)